VVHVELADMYWVEAALLASVFLVYCVWVDKFVVGFKVDGLALVLTIKTLSFRVSHLDSSRTTD
jgi:hypothetical protein